MLALAAGGIAATIPGFIDVRVGAAIRAGGALAVFVVVYFFSPANLVIQEKRNNDSTLKLVDLSLKENPNDNSEFPVLDIKLRNAGAVAAFLKRAEIEILDRVQFEDCVQYSAEPMSWSYQLNLDSGSPFPLSQVVPSGGVDRFGIVIGHSVTGASTHVFYKLRLVIYYDEDDKRLVSKPFTLLLSGMARRRASASTGEEEEKNCFQEMRKTMDPVRSWPVAYSLPNYFKDERKD